MTDADYRQQEELERERMEETLNALYIVWNRGLHDEAIFLAGECGVLKNFRQLINQRKAA